MRRDGNPPNLTNRRPVPRAPPVIAGRRYLYIGKIASVAARVPSQCVGGASASGVFLTPGFPAFSCRVLGMGILIALFRGFWLSFYWTRETRTKEAPKPRKPQNKMVVVN